MQNLKTPLLTRGQAAEYLCISPSTLAVWVTTKRYDLPYVKIGGRVFYTQSDLDEFIARSTIK
jgi:predicted DNA-binding transcriptional regulator AlpA